MKADYKMGDIFFTSAVYAFKAECSKNDRDKIKAILTEKDIWDLFVLPSIDWSTKGNRSWSQNGKDDSKTREVITPQENRMR